MARWFTRQWLWRSRTRMLTVGVFVLGVAAAWFVMNESRDKPSRRSYFRQLYGCIGLAVIGTGIVVPAVLSGKDAFGDADDSNS